jgi:hypothetical protein
MVILYSWGRLYCQPASQKDATVQSSKFPYCAVVGVTFSKVRRKSELSVRMVNDMCVYRGVYMSSYVYVYTRKSSSNPNSNALEPGRPEHARPATCVMGQQCCSAATGSLRFHSRKQKISCFSKIVLIYFCFTSRNLRNASSSNNWLHKS